MTELSEHLPRLRRYARALTGDRYAADDLVQDTVERALNKAALWRPDSRLDAWLMTLMHNIFVNQLHTAAGRQTDSLETLASEPAARATQADGIEVRDIHSALALLSTEQREVLLLVTLEEYSYDETAHILDIPVGTVMSRLSRARDRMRQLIEGAAPRTLPLKVVK
jgi:RNA polymerase sigma-70 factor (ECF subfamily)